MVHSRPRLALANRSKRGPHQIEEVTDLDDFLAANPWSTPDPGLR